MVEQSEIITKNKNNITMANNFPKYIWSANEKMKAEMH
jgi:hypothetical protein